MINIKSMLKEARKLIDDNKFNEAQEKCKIILSIDKNNYTALVYSGKLFQDSEKASVAFLRAIDVNPDNPIAWQGLACYYERQEDIEIKSKLFDTYNTLLILMKENEKKVLEIINKVGKLGCSLKNNKAVSIILRYLVNREHEKYHDAAEKQLLELLRSDVVCSEEDIPIIVVHLKQMLIKDEDDFPTKTLLAKVILQKKDLVTAFIELTELSYFQSNAFREYICRHLCTNFIEHESFFKLDVEQYIYDLTRECKDQKYSVLLNSMVLYEKGFCTEAFKQCEQLINYRKPDPILTEFLIKCAFKIKKWQSAEKISSNFLNKLKDLNFNNSLRKYLLKSLVEQEKWKEALSISKFIPTDSLDDNEQAIVARCYIENDEDAGDIMENLQTTKHYLQLQALILFKQEKYHDAIALLEQAPDYPLNLFFIGKSYWELKEYSTSFTYLTKAAELKRDHSYTFLYLGMYYQNIESYYFIAKRYYEEAYILNSIDGNILLNLSDVYIKLDLNDHNFTILYKAYNALYLQYPWICFRLGIAYINNRLWQKAVLQFQNVIKTDICSPTAYECLADAYYGRGAYRSAQGTYDKAMAEDPGRKVHCLTKIGYVHMLLTYHDNAILSFKKVLELDPEDINALKGMADSWLKIAQNKLSNHLFGRARDCAQNAINYVLKAIKVKIYPCLWSCLAKILMFITSLPDIYAFADITLPTGESVRKDKIDVYKFAFAVYSRLAKQKGETTSYNLALAYYKYYYATQDKINCENAYQLVLECVILRPGVWRNWNLLGCICIHLKRYDFAQHCLFKGLELTSKRTVPKILCNLGFLYVKLSDYIKANYCFSLGQCSMITYQKCWIGQGLCAEAIREREAMDLFRHANSLGNHPESAVAFSDWMCRILKNYNHDRKPSPGAIYFVETLFGVTLASDLLVWVTTKTPSNVCASNYLGYFQEKSGLLRLSLKSYKNAFQYATDDKKNIILLSIGRVYTKLGRYDQAVKTYKAVTEASLESACGLALALYKKKNYKEAYDAYDTALQGFCNKDKDKAEVLVAMANTACRLKDLNSAKTLLFRGVKLSQQEPNPYILFAICSLGYMQSDQSLSSLALKELQIYKKKRRYGADVIFLEHMCGKDVCKDIDEDIHVLKKCLQYNPRDFKLCYLIAYHCLKSSIELIIMARSCTRKARAETYLIQSKTKAKKAGYYARRALTLSRDHKNSGFSAQIMSIIVKAKRLQHKKSKALKLAKKNLHLNPWHPKAWLTFMSLMQKRKKLNQKIIMWLMTAIQRIRKKRNMSRRQIKWISRMEKKLRRIKRKKR